MAAKSLMGFLLLLLVATSINISAAQTSYLVGDELGWTIPPGGDITYATWAANKTFAVLDKLVFNFTSGAHNVAEVSKADFDACTTATPISLHATSPATVTLNTQGEHYFICNFTSHCSFGQKLAINVTAAFSSPSPSPSLSPSPQVQPEAPVSSTTPSPAPAPQLASPAPSPAPVPSSAPVIHIVRGLLGWGIPANSSVVSYQTWAANNTFKVGDTLVFNYINQTHNVAQVTKEHLATCNTTSPLFFSSDPPTSITLTAPGEYFFTCTFPRHCSLGQQLAINVSGTATPTPTPTPSSSPSSPPGTVVPSTPTPTSSVANPPDGSSATALGVTGFSTVLFSIAVAFFY